MINYKKFKYYYVKRNKIYEIHEGSYYLDVTDSEVTEMVLPPNLNFLNCSGNNNLKSIKCNERLVSLQCYRNELTEIICNEKLKNLYCADNLLTNIVCNENLYELHCDNNLLTSIICNENLKKLSF